MCFKGAEMLFTSRPEVPGFRGLTLLPAVRIAFRLFAKMRLFESSSVLVPLGFEKASTDPSAIS